jgi:hypothetical protein
LLLVKEWGSLDSSASSRSFLASSADESAPKLPNAGAFSREIFFRGEVATIIPPGHKTPATVETNRPHGSFALTLYEKTSTGETGITTCQRQGRTSAYPETKSGNFSMIKQYATAGSARRIMARRTVVFSLAPLAGHGLRVSSLEHANAPASYISAGRIESSMSPAGGVNPNRTVTPTKTRAVSSRQKLTLFPLLFLQILGAAFQKNSPFKIFRSARRIRV